MRRPWRLCRRACAAAAITAAVELALLLVWILTFASVRSRRRLQRAIFRAWSRALCRFLAVDVRVEGTVPEPPCILVSNHLSYLDVPVIAGTVPARFVARADVRGWPLVGWVCRSVETIFIDRASRRDAHRTVQTMRRGLEAGDAIALFPEGTSGAGHTVQPFRAPLLAAPAELGLPVHHAAIHYQTGEGDPPAHLAVSWWGEMDFLPHVLGLLQLSSIRATVQYGELPIRDSDRKQLTQKLHAAVMEDFTPLVDFEPDDPSRS